MSTLERLTIALVFLVGAAALAGGGFFLLRRGAASPREGEGAASERTPPAVRPPAALVGPPPPSPGPPADEPRGSLSGTAVDGRTREPIAGADVTAYVLDREPRAEARGKTDAGGRFLLSGVRAGAGAWLVVSAPGRAPGFCERIVVVRDRVTDAGMVALEGEGGRVEGWIQAPGGARVPGADVRLLAMVATGEQTRSLAPLGAVVTEADGRFSFGPLSRGRHYTVMATKAGYASVTQTRVYVPSDGSAPPLALEMVKQ